MPAEIARAPEATAPHFAPDQFPPRKRWTRPECAFLESTGLWDRERLELIEGELITHTGKKRPHINTTMFVQHWLSAGFGPNFVNQAVPIDVAPSDNPTNEPVPDLIVLAAPSHHFHANPTPADIRLLIEVSDTTLAFDRGIKARLYARAGIADYWVIDVAARKLHVHRDPAAGQYRTLLIANKDQSIAPLAAPENPFPVARAFSPPAAG